MATIFLAFYIWGAHWRHLANKTEPSVCGGDAALCQITMTTCWNTCHYLRIVNSFEKCLKISIFHELSIAQTVKTQTSIYLLFQVQFEVKEVAEKLPLLK